MNNQQRFNELKWKFFWEQKWDEIGNFLAIILVIILGALVGLVVAGVLFAIYEYFSLYPEALIYLSVGIVTCGILVLLLYLWIRSNLRKAEARARCEILRATANESTIAYKKMTDYYNNERRSKKEWDFGVTKKTKTKSQK